MKAIVYSTAESKPVLGEWPKPEPGPDEVVIRIHSAALNRRDLNITRTGLPEPFVYGSDGAGTIDAVGDRVREWRIGDEVIINSYVSCMVCRSCMAGEHTYCEQGRVLGSLAWPGTFAEFVRVPARNIERKPRHLDFRQAAALPLSFGTAWRALITRAKLRPGQSVFIQGIGGGVSLYALQIAVAMGCRAVVSSSSYEKLSKAMKAGACAGIHYKEQDVVAEANKLTDGRGFDVIVSSHAGTLPQSLEACSVGGKIIQYAYLGDKLAQLAIDTLMMKQISLIGTGDHTYREFQQGLAFVNQTKLIPTVSQVFAFERVEEAFACMRNGEQFGKIVLELNKEQLCAIPE